MVKFNKPHTRATATSPIVSAVGPELTFEGGTGYSRDTKSELFLLAVSNMVGENTFYETESERDDRYAQLVRAATVEDPAWTADFLRWLRGEGNMRSASLVGAAEYAKAALDAKIPGARQVIGSVLQRADEPGEFLAYWTSKHGRRLPMPVKRGVADAAARLYNEGSLLKYDRGGYRFGDVIELTHPTPGGPWQSDLFRHAINTRKGRTEEIPETLGMLRARAHLMAIPVEKRRRFVDPEWFDPDVLREAGMTWEAVAGWLQGPMDRQAWEAVIPTMGYMALLRNLRNFDEAGVTDEVAQWVASKLTDPHEVASSRQLPMRFLSAYKAAPSLRWSYPLERALGHSLRNVPVLSGRTLILVDRSGSMFWSTLSERSTLTWAEAAAVFGAALAVRCENADLAEFDNAPRPIHFRKGESVLKIVERFGGGGGTDTARAVAETYQQHDRVVIVTDEQSGGYSRGGYRVSDPMSYIPARVPVYTWNLAGYRQGHGPSGSGNRHTFGGLSDAAFKMIPLLECSRDSGWPWTTS